MKKYILMWMVMLITGIAYSQNTFSARILDSETKEALAGASASIDSLRLHSSADENGLVTISNIPDGTYEIEFSFLGYNENVTIVSFPLNSDLPIDVLLISDSEELEEVVIISSTRSTRTIQNIPTRVEFISGEEL